MSVNSFALDDRSAAMTPGGAGTDRPVEPAPGRRRVVHVCTRFAYGGSEQRLCDMVAALSDHEHVVIVGAASDLELATRRLAGAEVVVEPSLRRSVTLRHDILAFYRLRRLIEELDPEIVVTHQSKAGVLGRLAARTAGAPPVVHSLSMADFGSGYGAVEGRLFRFLEHHLARWTAAYAVVGTDLAANFGRIGVPDEELAVIRSTVRLPPVESNRVEVRRRVAQTFGLTESRPWILYVGSLDERKSVLDLPIMLQQAIQLTAGSRPFLVVAGSGPQEERLRSLLDQVGLTDDSKLLGYVQDPSDLFLASDALVLLSRAEGLPQVLVQAAAAGTPFVTTEVDGADELLELGARGSVVEPGDIVGAARAVLPYLRWPVDRDGATIDLTSWSPTRVRSDYRGLFDSIPSTDRRTADGPGRIVALIGSDGSGKSTLSRALAEDFGGRQPVMHMYFGSGDGPSSLIRWPLKRVKRAVFGAGSAARQQAVHERAPRAMGVSRAVWALVLAREKDAKLRRARRAARRGTLVLCDRYPQAQVPGTTDGPLLDAWASSTSRFRRRLARWEARPYELAEARPPDLVIRLRVGQESAVNRRPKHDPEALRFRRSVVEDLRFDGATFGVVEVDANRPLEVVLADARGTVEACLFEPSIESR